MGPRLRGDHENESGVRNRPIADICPQRHSATMKGWTACLVIVALLTLTGCAKEPPPLNENLDDFAEAARTCLDTVCSTDFAANGSCQRALKLQSEVKINDPKGAYSDGSIEFLQGRIVLEKAYSKDLERRLGASAMSHTVCGMAIVPLREQRDDRRSVAE